MNVDDHDSWMDGQLDRKSVNLNGASVSFADSSAFAFCSGTNWVLSSVIFHPDFAESSAPAFSLSAGFGSRSNPRGELNTSILRVTRPGTWEEHEFIFL